MRSRSAAVGAAVLGAVVTGLGAGCEQQTSPAAAPAKPAAPAAPAATTARFQRSATAVVAQRSAVGLPEGNPAVLVWIGDITRGQVAVTVRTLDGRVLAGPQSLRVRDRLAFELDSEQLALTLTKLDNAFIGNDHATIAISPRATTVVTVSGATIPTAPVQEATPPTSAAAGAKDDAVEQNARIERLIDDLASATGLVFIRNDGEHSPSEAAAHLRRKWNAARSTITTAEEFINVCGTRSSSSGEAYRVRLADGHEMWSRQYLLERLRVLDGVMAPGAGRR